MSKYRRKIEKAIDNPRRVAHRLRQRIVDVDRRFYDPHPDAVDVVERDWDTLILLDGCRYDTFVDRIDPPGTVTRVHSPGAESWEFMEATFAGRELHDTVYTTANPHVDRLPAGTFHSVDNLLIDEWDADLGTVPPSRVVAAAIENHDRFPHKRHIVHFMQPHFPFLGPAGEEIERSGFVRSASDIGTDDVPQPWHQIDTRPGVTVDAVRRAYAENLDIVWDVVEGFVEQLDGKTVVSADHGNLLGERLRPIPVRAYGHPRGIHHPALVAVPWVEVDSASRRDVRSDTPVRTEGEDEFERVVDDRLRALGYA